MSRPSLPPRPEGQTSTTSSSSRPGTSNEHVISDLEHVEHERHALHASSYLHNIARKSSINLSKSAKHTLQYLDKQRIPSSLASSFQEEKPTYPSDRPLASVRSKSRPPVVLHRTPSLGRRRSFSSRPYTGTISLPDDTSHTSRAPDLNALLTGSTATIPHRKTESDSTRSSISAETYNNMMSNYGNGQIMYGSMSVGSSAPGYNVPGLASPTMESISYQHIQEMTTKRISTLDYLRKAFVSFLHSAGMSY